MSASTGSARPLVMGILNVTPDSFSDGGRWPEPEAALARAEVMIAEGADIIDVGGESSRPRALAVPTDEELRRVLPVIEGLAGRIRISVDTVKEEVARAAAAAGATLINDVSSTLGPVAAELGVGWVAMHRQGSAATMQENPHYEDVVREVRAFLEASVHACGVGEVWIDPGIGFGKTVEHNLQLLAALDAFASLGQRVMVGTSRKAFLGVLGAPDGVPVEARLPGSLASAVWAMQLGAEMVRVHDVAATVQAAQLVGRRSNLEVAA